jgi:hypothetical protein
MKYFSFMILGQRNYVYGNAYDNSFENDASTVLEDASDSCLDCINMIDDLTDGAVTSSYNEDLILSHSRYCEGEIRSMGLEIVKLMRDCQERLSRAHSLIEMIYPGFLSGYSSKIIV